MFEITLPLPCSVNESYAIVRGRKILTKKARLWRHNAVILIRQKNLNKIHIQKSIKLSCISYFYFPDYRKRDQSNYIKQLYDSLVQSTLIHDDSQIFEEHIYKIIEKDRKEVKIIIKPIEK